ncbi:MAG: LPS export ABC transporter ATP-binding protein [Gemmataceae bacterium]
MSLLEVKGLVKKYGRRTVVDGVSFDVNSGEVVGLLGPNGAGKTTSFRMATGQITPNDGEVWFDSHDVTELPMFRRARLGMGYLSQEQSVFKKLSVEDNLFAILEALPASRSLGRKLTKRERIDRTDEALTRFNLQHVRKNTAGRCSGGEKRRLEIARCLVCEPSLILLDEPFAAVDPKTTEDIRQNIRDLAKQNIGVLLTDHNVREVLRIADRIYLIVGGKVVTSGTPQELVRDKIAIDAYLGRSFEDDGLPGWSFTQRDEAAVELVQPLPPLPKPAVKETYHLPPVPPPSAPITLERAAPATPEAIPVSTPELNLDQPIETPQSFKGTVAQLLEQEKIRRLVEQLRDRTTMEQAWKELSAKGREAVPVLLEALERREVDLRHVAFRCLQFITQEPLDFQADASEELRFRQVAYLRLRLEGRKVG